VDYLVSHGVRVSYSDGHEFPVADLPSSTAGAPLLADGSGDAATPGNSGLDVTGIHLGLAGGTVAVRIVSVGAALLTDDWHILVVLRPVNGSVWVLVGAESLSGEEREYGVVTYDKATGALAQPKSGTFVGTVGDFELNFPVGYLSPDSLYAVTFETYSGEVTALNRQDRQTFHGYVRIP
jgi:hypothetical protein